MADSIVNSSFFTECDELAEFIKHGDLEAIQIDKGKLFASIYHINFSKLDIQFGRINGASIIETGTTHRDYFGFLYDLHYHIPTITDGYEIDKNSFTYYPPNTEHCSIGSKAVFWAYISIKNNDKLFKLTEEMKFPTTTSTHITCYNVEAFENMRNLIYQIEHLAQNEPDSLNSTEERQYYENELLDAQIDLLLKSDKVQKYPSSREKNKIIVSKFIEYTRFRDYNKLNISDFCSDYGVSLRTAYYAFEDIVKKSPYKYIKLYRLNKAHRQLLNSNPNRNSVWRIAIQNKFCHLGRFSVDYKQLFGESPSETLKIVK